MVENTINEIDSQEDFKIGDIWNIFWQHKVWFLISVIICFILASLYILSTPKTYSRQASVLIKDEAQKSPLSDMSSLTDMGYFLSSTNVFNEIQAFKSEPLMEVVVKKLKLCVNYSLDGVFKKTVLYTKTPIEVSFPDAQDEQSFSFVMTPISKTKVRLSDFAVKDEPVGASEIEVNLNDTVTLPIGRAVFTPTLYFNDDMYSENIIVSKAPLLFTAMSWSKRISANLSEKMTAIIDLSITDVSTQRAEDVLNTLIMAYTESWLNDRNISARNTSKFINERLQIIEKELGGVDSEIEEFKSQNQLTNIAEAARLYMTEKSEYANQNFQKESQLSIAKYIKSYLFNPKNAGALLPANTGIENSNIEDQISDYNELLLKREKLITNSSDKNPAVEDLNNSIAAMKQAISRSIDNVVVTLEMQIRSIKGQETQMVNKISNNPGQERQLLSIERQQKIKESLYLYLLQKREENEISGTATVSNTRIISPALGVTVPDSPKKSIVYLVALIIGLIVPFGVFKFKELLDTSVRGKMDLQGLSVPFLGEIPLDKEAKNNESHKIIVREDSRDAASEAFRVVRSNMDFMRVNKEEMKTVMLISFVPGSGKTFTSLNLAMSFALIGKKVLMLDMDLRKATLSSLVNLPKNGITNFLSGRTSDISSLIVNSGANVNLDVLPVGAIPPNPTELLLSPKLEELLTILRKEYDYIFIDSTPIEMLADSTIISKYVDLSIFIVRQGLLDRRRLPELEEIYKAKRYNNMALLLNGSDWDKGHYGYYGYRKYGYGDYYSNGDAHKKSKYASIFKKKR